MRDVAVLLPSASCTGKEIKVREGRLRGGLAPEVAEEMMAGHLREQARHFPVYMRVHRAHTVMLAERGIVGRADAAAILGALAAIEA